MNRKLISSAVLLLLVSWFALWGVVGGTQDTWHVSTGTDDAAVYTGTADFENDGVAIYVGNHSVSTYLVGDGYFRWTDVDIPQGYGIISASLKLYVNAKVNSPQGMIYGIDEDDTATFSSDPSGRSLTGNATEWDIPSNGWKTSPDIAEVIQEILDRSGWSSGNALGLKFADDDSATDNYATIYSYDQGSTYGANLTVTYTQYRYTLRGLYDETDGTRDGAVNVTVTFPSASSETVEVDGIYDYRPTSKPSYFTFDLDNDREYWLSDLDGDEATIYIFDASTTTYTIQFIDLGGTLDDYSYVLAKCQVNGTLYTVEKRQTDVNNKVIMNLIQNKRYNVAIEDDVSYDFGEEYFGSDTTPEITLSGMEFPPTIIEGYKYVRIWAYRDADDATDLKVNYEDTQSETNNVSITYYYTDGTTAYETYSTSDSFISTWSSADENTTYYLVAAIDRDSGAMEYRQVLARTWGRTNPWDLDFLWASAPFSTNILIPALIILCVAGVFSSLNVPVGAFAAVATAIVLWWLWGLSIPEEALLIGVVMAFLIGISYAKRRVQIF